MICYGALQLEGRGIGGRVGRLCLRAPTYPPEPWIGSARVSRSWRAALVVGLLGLGFAHPGMRPLLLGAMEEAWLAVGVFVAGTFALVFLLEARLGIDIQTLLARHPRTEIPLAAFLGAMPGCGGAVVVVTHFAAGQVSFGSLVAVLVATMGDAAFFVLAQRPAMALALMAIGFVAGVLSGWLVDRVHGRDFMRLREAHEVPEAPRPTHVPAWLWVLWGALLVPGLAIGILGLFQVEVPTIFLWIFGVGGAGLSLALWAWSPTQVATLAAARPPGSFLERVARNTNFVTVWVVMAFLAYELAVQWGGLDVGGLFESAPLIMPLLGALVGFLPGCGPQIVVSMLYLAGAVPFSTQVANAISNDGDALFPAIAVAPRAAVVATLYTAVPALLIGYAVMLLFE